MPINANAENVVFSCFAWPEAWSSEMAPEMKSSKFLQILRISFKCAGSSLRVSWTATIATGAFESSAMYSLKK
jgi:hypothetical protein